MKTINKYITLSFFSTFLTYLFIIAFLIFLNYLYQILNTLFLHRPDLSIILNLFFHLMPSVVSLTVPITFLLSTIMCLSLLNEHRELLTLHTMGLDKTYYTKNLFLISIIIAVILMYFNAYIVPESYKNFKFIYFKQIISKPFINFQDNGVVNLENKKIFTKKVYKNNAYGIYIHNLIDGNILQTIYAKEANIRTDPQGNVILYLLEGKMNILNFQLHNEILTLSFKHYKFPVYKSEFNKFVPYNKTFREMNNKELIEEFNNSNLSKYKKLVLSEYFLRYTLSFSVIFFLFIGVLIGSIIQKNAKSLSFVASLLIILIYYFILSTSLTIIERVETLPLSFEIIGLIMNLPNFVILLICGVISIIQKVKI
ncbi:MAG: LptF/LptG family permease [Endomicrobiia bacterium]